MEIAISHLFQSGVAEFLQNTEEHMDKQKEQKDSILRNLMGHESWW